MCHDVPWRISFISGVYIISRVEKSVQCAKGTTQVCNEPKSKNNKPADMVGERPLPGLYMALFSQCPHVAEKVRELLGVSFIMALDQFMGALLL